MNPVCLVYSNKLKIGFFSYHVFFLFSLNQRCRRQIMNFLCAQQLPNDKETRVRPDLNLSSIVTKNVFETVGLCFRNLCIFRCLSCFQQTLNNQNATHQSEILKAIENAHSYLAITDRHIGTIRYVQSRLYPLWYVTVIFLTQCSAWGPESLYE